MFTSQHMVLLSGYEQSHPIYRDDGLGIFPSLQCGIFFWQKNFLCVFFPRVITTAMEDIWKGERAGSKGASCSGH